MKGKDYHITTYTTEWADSTMTVISLFDSRQRQRGIVEVEAYKGRKLGESFILNLHVMPDARRMGYGRVLLTEALDTAARLDCDKTGLFWDYRDTPEWVREWYMRCGFRDVPTVGKRVYMEKDMRDYIKTMERIYEDRG